MPVRCRASRRSPIKDTESDTTRERNGGIEDAEWRDASKLYARHVFPTSLLAVLGLLAIVGSACGGSDADTLVEPEGGTTTTEQQAPTSEEIQSEGTTPSTSSEGAETGDEPRFVLEGDLPLTTEEVNAMMAFIEEQTSRDFLYPPTIVAQSEADYEAGLAERSAEDLAEFEENVDRAARYYQATGLSEMGAAELGETVDAALSDADGVLGYYLPDDDKLFVPTDSGATDEFKTTVLHELVHAHDGQHVDLFTYTDELDDEDGEGQFVRRAIVEGRARFVEDKWIEANPPSETSPQEDLTEDQLALLLSLPPIFWNELLLPYDLGLQFIEVNGGASETWEFYETPPASSEQVLIPYRETGDLVDVDGTIADGEEVFRGSYGAVDLVLLLISETAEPAADTVIAAVGAADGWGGGELVIWGDDNESCIRIALVGDSATELAEIRTVLTEWAGSDDGRTVDSSADDQVQVTACAPYLG